MESLAFAPTPPRATWTVFDAPPADPYEPTPAAWAPAEGRQQARRDRSGRWRKGAQRLRTQRRRSGERLGGRYLIGERLGSGGMAEVYAAEDGHASRPLAVKILDRELSADPVQRRRFRQEYAILSALTHPNLVRATAFGEDDDGAPFFVMERLSGTCLAERLRHCPRLRVKSAIAIARQLCAALTALHRAGVVHRDVKPANIHVVGDLERPRIKLLDLGVAKIAGTPEEPLGELETPALGRPWTHYGMILGTPGYAPPEAGCSPVTPAYDVYAVGVLLYRVLTGKLPFATPVTALGPLPKLGDVDVSRDRRAELEEILAGALDPYPAQRTSTIDEFAGELVRFAARLEAPLSPVRLFARSTRSPALARTVLPYTRRTAS